MIIRLVKMTFRETEIQKFRQLFDERKELIRNFPGCSHLELWQDSAYAAIFFTYSIWENEEALANYRASGFFNSTWELTKQLFAEKPQAWTIKQSAVVS